MRFEEESLRFEFGANWQDSIIKFDDHPDYHSVKDGLEQTRGVDFVGVFRAELYFIEVKDFRGYRIQNKQRLTKGELMVEVGQKVRDSVACVIGVSRTSSEREKWQTYKQFLCQETGRVRIILWLEQDQSRPDEVVKHGVLRNDLKRRLKWLGVRINVYSLQELQESLDLQVSSLPRQTH
jgi:hypothetical protein